MALQYEWLWGVGNTSQNAEAAWTFLKWLNNPRDGARPRPRWASS